MQIGYLGSAAIHLQAGEFLERTAIAVCGGVGPTQGHAHGAVITHTAFYAGWPKGWAVFNLAKEVWSDGEGDLPYEDEALP